MHWIAAGSHWQPTSFGEHCPCSGFVKHAESAGFFRESSVRKYANHPAHDPARLASPPAYLKKIQMTVLITLTLRDHVLQNGSSKQHVVPLFVSAKWHAVQVGSVSIASATFGGSAT